MKAIVISEKSVLAGQVRQALSKCPAPWDVVPAPNAEKALPAIDPHSLVFLDYDLDPLVGRAALKTLLTAQDFRDVQVLLVGERSMETNMKDAVKAGAAGYVLRPLDDGALRSRAEEAVKPVGSRQKLDVRLINPFINATTEVFKTMAQMEVSRKDLFLKKNYHMFGDVSGVMGLTGVATGSVVISMPGQLACVLVGRMLGETPQADVTDSVRDGIGEMVNMIAGHAKAAFAGSEYHFTLSLPVVVTGGGHEIAHKTGAPCIVVVFEADGKEFAVQVSLSPEK